MTRHHIIRERQDRPGRFTHALAVSLGDIALHLGFDTGRGEEPFVWGVSLHTSWPHGDDAREAAAYITGEAEPCDDCNILEGLCWSEPAFSGSYAKELYGDGDKLGILDRLEVELRELEPATRRHRLDTIPEVRQAKLAHARAVRAAQMRRSS